MGRSLKYTGKGDQKKPFTSYMFVSSIRICNIEFIKSAKYEFASSNNTTRTTFAFDACFVLKLALADE
jgi:hypothetical protein